MRESPEALCSHDPSVSQLESRESGEGVGVVSPVPREEKIGTGDVDRQRLEGGRAHEAG